MLRIKRTVQPTLEPVTVAEAMAHCRVDSSAEEVYIGGLVSVAREWAEDYTNTTIMQSTWQLTMDCWPVRSGPQYGSLDAGRIDLPRCPVQSVSSIQYVDENGATQTLDPSAYTVDTSSDVVCRVVPAYGQTWPSIRSQVGAITITYVAGQTLAANVPPRVRHAILLLVGHWFENREGVLQGTTSKEIEFAVRSLLDLGSLTTVG